MLTVAQHRDFQEQGFVRLPGAIAPRDAAAMCDHLWRVLADDHGIRRDAPETWTVELPSGIQGQAHSDVYNRMASPVVCAALDDLFSGQWQRPRFWGAPLVSFRASQRWHLPHGAWHLDAPAKPGGHEPAAVVFVFLADVAEGGGGTLALAGSHRLVASLAASSEPPQASAEVRKALMRAEPWLKALWSADGTVDRVQKFMVDGSIVRGVPLRVVEFTGQPGDAIIWHPWLFHTRAPNCRPMPRLMLRHPLAANAATQPV